MMTSITAEIARRINFDCDRVRTEGDTIYFYFDSPEKWQTIFIGMVGVYDAVVRAMMLGFDNYVFVEHDGEECRTTRHFWTFKTEPRRQRRSRLK